MKVAQKPRRTDGCADQAWLDAGAGAQPALRRWPPCSISRGFHDLRVIVPVWCCRSAAFQRFPTAAKIALVARNSSALDAMVPLPSLTGTVVMQHNRSVKIRNSHPATTVFSASSVVGNQTWVPAFRWGLESPSFSDREFSGVERVAYPDRDSSGCRHPLQCACDSSSAFRLAAVT
jgi:hypothetical protein